MYKNKYSISLLSLIYFFVFYLSSCNPVIKSFKVTTTDNTGVKKITSDDTLKVNWIVKGKPTLLVLEKQSPDSVNKILEMDLVVERGGKEARQVEQVEIIPKNSATSIAFSTELRGDTLVAEGDKNPGVWGDHFEIISVSNASGRPLTVAHFNRTALLDKGGASSNIFTGTPVEGRWEFKSVLTAAEKADHSSLPERLQVNTTINYKMR